MDSASADAAAVRTQDANSNRAELAKLKSGWDVLVKEKAAAESKLAKGVKELAASQAYVKTALPLVLVCGTSLHPP